MFDAPCASSGSKRSRGDGLGSTQGMGICRSYAPDGRCISLLEVLLTNVCIYDCAYCINRRSSDVERATFETEEVVRLTMECAASYSRELRPAFRRRADHSEASSFMSALSPRSRHLEVRDAFQTRSTSLCSAVMTAGCT